MFKNQNTVLLIFYKILSLFGFMETDKNLNSNFNGYFYWLFTVFNLIIVNLHVLLQISYLIWNSESSIDFQEQFFFCDYLYSVWLKIKFRDNQDKKY